VDDFEDSTFDPHWFPWGNDVSEMAGGLQFQVPPTSTEYSGVTSQQSYDLRGCAIAIEVLTVPTSTPSAEAYLAVSDNVANSSLAMGAHDGELFMRHFEDSGLVSEDTLPFDPTNHRWWRMSEDGGQIVFATSADGVSWTNRWQIGTPAFVSTVMVDIIAGAYASNDSSATATFDNLNILPRP
jgi:hypothetical protein